MSEKPINQNKTENDNNSLLGISALGDSFLDDQLEDHEINIDDEIKPQQFKMLDFANTSERRNNAYKPKESVLKKLPSSNTINILSNSNIQLTVDDFSLENLITYLKKKPSERLPKDLSVINKFLHETDLVYKFKSDSLEENSLERMLYFCSMYINFKHLEKNKTLFHYGDIGDKFYIILKGSVNILKPVAKRIKMTALEYYNYLKEMKNKNEIQLVKNMIAENREIYPIDITDIDNEEISFKIRYRRTLIERPSTKDIEKVFVESGVNPDKYDLDYKQMNENELNQKVSFSNKVQQQLNLLSPHNEFTEKFDQYRYVENELDKRLVIVYDNELFLKLTKGQYFGDVALESAKFRGATIISEEDCFLGYLDIDVYREYIQIEKQRLTTKEIMFLLDNYFFTTIKKKAFEKRYFGLFIQEDLYRGHTIFKENEECKYIYMIKEGEVELSINKNVLEIHKILKNLQNLKLCDSNRFETYLLKNEPKNFLNELMKNKLIKLFLYNNKELLGLEELFFNLNYLYTAKVVSEKIKVYKIEAKNILNIIQEEKECYHPMEKMAKQKMIKFIERLVNVKNITLKMLDNSITEKNIYEKMKVNKDLLLSSNRDIGFKFTTDDRIMQKMKYEKIVKQTSKIELVKFDSTNSIKLNVNIFEEDKKSIKEKSKTVNLRNQNLKSLNNETIFVSLPSIEQSHHNKESKAEKFIYENKQIKKLKKQMNDLKKNSLQNTDFNYTNTNTNQSTYETYPTEPSKRDMSIGTNNTEYYIKTEENKTNGLNFLNKLQISLSGMSSKFEDDKNSNNLTKSCITKLNTSNGVAYVDFLANESGDFSKELKFKYAKKLKNKDEKKIVNIDVEKYSKLMKKNSKGNNSLSNEFFTFENGSNYTKYNFLLKHNNISINNYPIKMTRLNMGSKYGLK